MAKYNCPKCGKPLMYKHTMFEGDTVSSCGYCEKENQMDDKALEIIKKALKIKS